MTCIVGYVERAMTYETGPGNKPRETGRRVWIGGDSAATDDLGGFQTRRDPKVFKRGDYLIGCAGSPRGDQIIRHATKLPRWNGRGLWKFMCTDFIETLRETLKKGGVAGTPRGEVSEDCDIEMLVGCYGHLFEVWSDFQISEVTWKYSAVGSAADIALGAMCVSPELPSYFQIHPGKILTLALQAAARHAADVGPPFKILSILHKNEDVKKLRERAKQKPKSKARKAGTAGEEVESNGDN